ncbi:MAG: lipopolysaccharide biosynthesis protein [Paracoccus sp. (in: a-proteobacteria)]|uniref:GumC family protein n=1 Tax=Paracoccus sp. TaxID=267 RepID=UPI0026DF92BE|nr:lipopolysaccharide biosynthesis protein [Paracoccus sp. (in: a-proteobacteria)]MDO5613443.1 lipopolysaccharide biosynthesis protein [Paracoccus sp. (in: a-proteobacteria)]
MIQEVRFYFSLFLRRIHYFILLTVLGAAIGITFALLMAPEYMARARLVVESEQIPDDLAASTVHTRAFEQLQIIQQRILSRDNMLDMANRMNIYADRQRSPETALRPDEIVQDMRDRIQMTISGGAPAGRNATSVTTVQVGFVAPTGQMAAAVTNEIVTLILDENVRMRTGVSGQTLQFFAQEVQRLERELADRRSRIVDFQEQNKEALPDSLEFRRSQYSNAQARLLQLETQEQSLVSRRDSVRALFDATGQYQTTGNAENMTPEARELARLRERYAGATGGTNVENPRVRVLRERIASLEEIVAQQDADAAAAAGAALPEGTPMTPVDIQIADLDTQIRGVLTEKERLEADIARLSQTIEATPANAVTLETLQRDYDNVRTQYDRAVANRARAETGDLIEALSKGERISIVEQAVPPEEPFRPNRKRLVAAGVGGGMLLGFALIALLELLNNSIRRPADIVNRLDIVPLASLSYMRTRGEIARRKMMFVGIAALVIIGLPLGLWLINEFVTPLDLLMDRVMDNLPFRSAMSGLTGVLKV